MKLLIFLVCIGCSVSLSTQTPVSLKKHLEFENGKCTTVNQYLLKNTLNVDLSICDRKSPSTEHQQETPIFFITFCAKIRLWTEEESDICNTEVTDLIEFEKKLVQDKTIRLNEICDVIPKLRPDIKLDNCSTVCSGRNYDACNLYEALDFFIRKAVLEGIHIPQ